MSPTSYRAAPPRTLMMPLRAMLGQTRPTPPQIPRKKKVDRYHSAESPPELFSQVRVCSHGQRRLPEVSPEPSAPTRSTQTMSRHGFSRIGYSLLAGSLAFGIAAAAQNQQAGNLSDAQVEANVLRALAGAPELSTQNIQSSTVYGTVTLTGNVHDEAMRTKAENLVARAVGVKKVVDELTLGDSAAPADQASTADPNASQPPNCELQSDGTCAPSSQPSQQAENTPPPIPNQGQPDYGQQQRPSAAPQQSQGSQYPGGYGP